MALFLAADDSAMRTAQDFIVDGGWVPEASKGGGATDLDSGPAP